ncbi:MAG TPA: DUF4331 domain-containing protein [Thermoleophilaceae bacterium]|jgi:Domain of unknown function (DUF4331)|nr:DUF4331 domain-containing protein [Thermoleophilaceae bacterium]
MKRLAILAALVAVAVAVPLSIGSSHREAPRILKDPTADNTDVWAFTAPDAPGSVTVVSNWIPLADPAGGPNFYPLDENARYYVKFDNTGDGYEDVAYRWDFDTKFRNPNSFLYAAPTVDSVRDPDLNLVQTYDLYKETYNRKRKLTSVKRIANDAPVAPDNVGPKTIPNYAQVEAGATTSLKGGGKTTVIPADDAFFVDLGTIFDGINLDKPGRPNIGLGNQGGGKDDVAGYNSKSFVLQVPEREVTRDRKQVAGADAGNAVVGVWSTTERKRATVVRSAKSRKGKAGRHHRKHWVQVSRLGNPLINEVIIPIGMKDKFNATSPANDAKNFGKFALNPEPARILNALFNLGIKETNRTDIVQALLTGLPGLTQIGKNPAAADTLKLNLGVPPSANPSRFGALAGDNAGFPNGRRLIDDVVDIELRVIAGALLPANQGGKQIPLGDGVDRNDKPFRSAFPYVSLANDGFNSTLKRTEPQHAPVPQPPN